MKVMKEDLSQCSKIKNMVLTSPIGDLHVVVCNEGLHSVFQTEETKRQNFCPNLSIDVELCDYDDSDVDNIVSDVSNWLHTYFHNIKALENLVFPEICPSVGQGTFRGKVWRQLAKNVGPGHTVSYGALAKLCGNTGAAQAVGTAMATNPMMIIVPCHRVIKSNGSMGHYDRGTRNNLKAWLLTHEGVTLP